MNHADRERGQEFSLCEKAASKRERLSKQVFRRFWSLIWFGTELRKQKETVLEKEKASKKASAAHVTMWEDFWAEGSLGTGLLYDARLYLFALVQMQMYIISSTWGWGPGHSDHRTNTLFLHVSSSSHLPSVHSQFLLMVWPYPIFSCFSCFSVGSMFVRMSSCWWKDVFVWKRSAVPWTNPGLTCANALRHRRRHCDMENMGSTKDVRPLIRDTKCWWDVTLWRIMKIYCTFWWHKSFSVLFLWRGELDDSNDQMLDMEFHMEGGCPIGWLFSSLFVMGRKGITKNADHT